MTKVVWSYTQSCCGSKAAIATLPAAIKKSGAQVFRDAGWFVPDNWLKLGIFWVKKDNLVASSAYGATQIHIKCAGEKCPQLIQNFEDLIIKAI